MRKQDNGLVHYMPVKYKRKYERSDRKCLNVFYFQIHFKTIIRLSVLAYFHCQGCDL
jgi:hypothetical protein